MSAEHAESRGARHGGKKRPGNRDNSGERKQFLELMRVHLGIDDPEDEFQTTWDAMEPTGAVIDSLDVAELILMCEEEFAIHVSEDYWGDLSCPADLWGRIETLIADRPQKPKPTEASA